MIPDAPLTAGQMWHFWLIVGVLVFVALIIGDAISRGRQ